MVAVDLLLLYVHIQDGINAPEETKINLSDHQITGEFIHFSEYFWSSLWISTEYLFCSNSEQWILQRFLQENADNHCNESAFVRVLTKDFPSEAVFSSSFYTFLLMCWLNINNHCKRNLCKKTWKSNKQNKPPCNPWYTTHRNGDQD